MNVTMRLKPSAKEFTKRNILKRDTRKQSKSSNRRPSGGQKKVVCGNE